MSYCREHDTDNPCIACELREQTDAIVTAIQELQPIPHRTLMQVFKDWWFYLCPYH